MLIGPKGDVLSVERSRYNAGIPTGVFQKSALVDPKTVLLLSAGRSPGARQ